jgi:hypothetical protein
LSSRRRRCATLHTQVTLLPIKMPKLWLRCGNC